MSAYRLQGLVKDVAHLVLKVLSGDKRVQEVETILSLESDDLAASASDVGIDVKGLPEMVNGCGTGHGTYVQEDTDVRLKDGTESVEEPAMRVDLFLILFLETENDLDWTCATLCAFKTEFRGDGYLGRVLVNVGGLSKGEKNEQGRLRSVEGQDILLACC
jgi:hypothetical protein